MGRPLRQAVGGIVYHVLNRRVLRLPLFEDEGYYLAFEKVLLQAMQREDAPELFTFCLMPNHWHLLLRPKANGDLPRWMQWLTVTHTHRWHSHHQTSGTGPVYQGRFKSFPVQEDEHFLTVARYVERNALQADLIPEGRAEKWRWCSAWLRNTRSKRKQTDIEIKLAGLHADWPIDRPSNWNRILNTAMTDKEVQAIQHRIHRGNPMGDPHWTDRIVERLQLHSTVRPRGRPVNHDKSS
jgi:putative transposase